MSRGHLLPSLHDRKEGWLRHQGNAAESPKQTQPGAQGRGEATARQKLPPALPPRLGRQVPKLLGKILHLVAQTFLFLPRRRKEEGE